MATETLEIKGKQIVIERWREELIPQFLELFYACFGKKIDSEHSRIKHQTLELGGSFLGYMAFHNQKPVAFYGVLAVPFILNGKPLTAVQSADTMTHSDYRRHGLFPLLAKKTYELAKSEGASFVFGWPNQNSFPTFKSKLDWKELGAMQRFSTHIPTLPLSKVFFKLSVLRHLYLMCVKKLLGATDALQSDFIAAENSIPRNEAYQKYKMASGAFWSKIGSEKLFVSLDYRLKIGDLTSSQLKKLPQIMKQLKRICFFTGITEIQIIVNPHSEMISGLADSGMQRSDDLPLMYCEFDESIQIQNLDLTGLDYDGF